MFALCLKHGKQNVKSIQLSYIDLFTCRCPPLAIKLKILKILRGILSWTGPFPTSFSRLYGSYF